MGCQGCLRIPVRIISTRTVSSFWVCVMYLCDGVLDNLLVRHIGLVAYQQLVDAFGGVAVNLLQPLLDIVEGVHISDIVDNADTMGAAVVRGCDGSEALLAGGVPLR